MNRSRAKFVKQCVFNQSIDSIHCRRTWWSSLRMRRDHSIVSSLFNISLYITLRKVLILFKSAIRLQLDTLLVRKRTINYLANTWLHLSGGKLLVSVAFLSRRCCMVSDRFLGHRCTTDLFTEAKTDDTQTIEILYHNTRIKINGVWRAAKW